MLINTVRCDKCGAEKAAPARFEAVPARGFLTIHGAENGTLHFCSAGCIVDWFENKMRENYKAGLKKSKDA